MRAIACVCTKMPGSAQELAQCKAMALVATRMLLAALIEQQPLAQAYIDHAESVLTGLLSTV